jgi:outer membrane lipoprotein-sorting protein
MSSHDRVPPADDALARSENALRRAPIPEGPSQETMARTLAALSEAAGTGEVIPFQRRKLMWTILKSAAAILATAGGFSYFAGTPPMSATAAFVAAAQQLRDAHTLSFRMSSQLDGMPRQKVMQIRYKDPGLVRYDVEPHGGPITVIDSVNGKILTLDPAQKSAILVERAVTKGREPRRDVAASIVDNLRQLAGKNGQPVGDKTIGDVRARGFLVKEDGQTMTVWVDPKAGLPLLIESTANLGSNRIKSTFAEIRIGPPLDDAIFRFEIPPGYALRKAPEPTVAPEEAVVRVLRAFADSSGGNFPSRLDDLPALNKAIARKYAKTKAQNKLDREDHQLSSAIGRVHFFSTELKDRYGYQADRVKLGDAGKIVFWYKPEGKTKYRVVYGDLHIGEATAEQLPKTK